MRSATWLFAGALVVTVLVYWTGLHGPFVLDDANNLNAILEWLHGENTWQHVLLDNASGMLGRSLSMATLMFSAWASGYDPFAFKLGNLFVHLLCGFVGWQMLRRALAHDPNLRRRADLAAALLAAVWLLHPLNVSTVLYAVQRMAQISTLFTLAALWAYLAARKALASGQLRRALGGLFVLFPLLVIAGLLGKENAAVAPALCLIIELAYFQQDHSEHQQPAVKRILAIFYSVFLMVPGVLAAVIFALHPDRFLGGYATRDFALPQRLLSEGRALLDYVAALLLPRGPAMGVFNDDFAVSAGLLSPPSTLFALFALATITVLAIALRKRAPSVFAGWFFFLVAHSIESSILPLELYFEHRNYLPAFGLLLAVAGMAELLTRRIEPGGLQRWQLGLLAAGGYALALGLATHARAFVWADEGRLLIQEATQHPGSVRANTTLAFYAIRQGNVKFAQDTIDNLLHNPDPRIRELAYLIRVLAACVASGNATANDLHHAVALARPLVTLEEMHVFADLASVNDQRICAGAGPMDLANAVVATLAEARAQSDDVKPKWSLRLTAARLYAAAGDWKLALPQAELAWQPGADAPVGAFLVRTYVHNGMLAKAQLTFAEVAKRINHDDTQDQQGFMELGSFLDRAKADSDKTHLSN
ncbi:MAG: hypothetical protein ABIS30_01235 [Gallionella sp.]